jgi:DNA polymerase IV
MYYSLIMPQNPQSPLVRTILHIDMDAFFTSIEQRDNTVYRGKPVVVGARPGHRGVVAAASYEARKFGIHSAMPINEAFKRCPSAVFLPPRMEVYSEESCRVMDVLHGFSPLVEQVSVDEAFLDATGTGKLFGDGKSVANAIRKSIKDRLSLTASIGMAPNKFLAKFASDLNKPDGLTIVPLGPQEIVSWLAPHPVGKIWGVGKKTEAVLRSMGIITIGDLQKKSRESLVQAFGEAGVDLHDLCRGIDNRPVGNDEDARSISREHTFEKDTSDREQWKKTLLALSQDVARSARKAGVDARTVVFIYRGTDFTKHTRRTTLASPTSLANVIFAHAVTLCDSLPGNFKLRLIGVGLTGFGGEIQLDLFKQENSAVPWEKSERAIDRLAERFGDDIVMRGTELQAPGKSER